MAPKRKVNESIVANLPVPDPSLVLSHPLLVLSYLSSCYENYLTKEMFCFSECQLKSLETLR